VGPKRHIFGDSRSQDFGEYDPRYETDTLGELKRQAIDRQVRHSHDNKDEDWDGDRGILGSIFGGIFR
jgi:hypothetical protein